jgi:hypothetical protein
VPRPQAAPQQSGRGGDLAQALGNKRPREGRMMAGVTTSKGSEPMAIVERNANRLVVEAGGGMSSFSLALDKQAGLARIERNMLMWKRRPLEMPLTDIKEFTVASFKDAASGAELRKLLMRTQADEAIELPVEEKSVEETAAALRDFLGLAA